jgi:hypothetical protein
METFMQRMKSLGGQAQAIRESLTIHDPSNPNFNPNHDTNDGFRHKIGANLRGTNQSYERAVRECAKLFADVYSGKRPSWHIQEAMSTSDFPYLFGDNLYRSLLGGYATYPVTYPAWTRVQEVNDFRTINMMTLEGGSAAFTETISQYGVYPQAKFVEGKYTLSVSKYGRMYGINWEMLINDDLNAFQSRPLMMAQGARMGEELLATKQAFDANGPHASFFTAGNANIITSNPALDFASLQTAWKILRKQKDADGNPIYVSNLTLVVPPALEIVANNIVNAMEVWLVNAGGSVTDQNLHMKNWFAQRFTVVVNEWIPTVVTTGTRGDTSWMLVSDPSNLVTRSAFFFGFLRGRRNPELFVKDPDARRLGGGDIPATEGSFDHDSIEYKCRHVFGAGQGDPKMAVASNGTGS